MIINLPIECPACKHTHEITIPTGKVKMVFRCINCEKLLRVKVKT